VGALHNAQKCDAEDQHVFDSYWDDGHSVYDRAEGHLAEGEGFEPPGAWRPLRFSRPLRSTAPASLRSATQSATSNRARRERSAGRPAQALELIGVLLEVPHEELLGDLRHRHLAPSRVLPDRAPLIRRQVR
jgi:hypothetical protein